MNPCGQLTSDLRGKTFSFQLYVESSTPFWGGDNDFTAGVLTTNQSFSQNISPVLNQWISVSFPLGMDASLSSAQLLYFEIYMLPTTPITGGGLCQNWDGTIYLDSFALQ